MTTSCVISWLLVNAIVSTEIRFELLLGMIMPLLMASATLIMAERAYRRSPKFLTSMMVKAFIGKMLIFGTYIIIVVGILQMQTVPFTISFVTYFTLLYLYEAIYLKRMFYTITSR